MTAKKQRFQIIIWLVLLACASAGAYADGDGILQNRLKALEAALSGMGLAKTEVVPAQVCWSADGSFSPVGVASQTPFGARGLAASIELKPVNTSRTINVIWTKDKVVKPLKIGTVTQEPGKSGVIHGFINATAPFSPGYYHVKFKHGGQDIGYGKINIPAPGKLGKRKVNEIYAQAIKYVQNALNEIDAGRVSEACGQAQKSLPLLATAMFSRASSSDAVGVNELVQSIIAVGKMNALATKNEKANVLDWAKRSSAHARAASKLITKNAALKKKAGEMAEILDKAIPGIENAVAR